ARHHPTCSGSDCSGARGFRSWHPPSGVLFTFPSRYCALSVARGISPWRVVPPASHGIPRAPRYSGSSPTLPVSFAYGALTPSGRPSQTVRLHHQLPRRVTAVTPTTSHNPGSATAAALARTRFGHQPRSLTTTRGLAVASFSSGY